MTTPHDRGWTVAVILGAVAVLAGATAAGIGALTLAEVLTVTGLPDPGPVTTFGVPAVRAAGEIAAVVAVGAFLFAAFLVPPQASGVLDAEGYRAVRLGGFACAVWAICAALLMALSVSDVSGIPLHQLSLAQIWTGADLVEITNAWRWTAGLAALVAVGSIPVLRWTWTPVLFVAALLTLTPLGLSGHSSSGGAHDIATNSLLVHLVAGAIWAGGLLALLAGGLRGGSHLDVAARRFSKIALACFVVMALTGIINAAIRIGPAELDTGYGLLVVVKAVALCGLGLIGWRQRRSGVAALQTDPTARGALLRLALTEAALFGVTVGVAVGLSRTPPPPQTTEPSAAEIAIGFDLAEPPSFGRILLDWRLDLLLGTAAIVLALVYLGGVRRLRRRAHPWASRRTVCWLSGCVALLVATSSGLGSYMPAMFSMHVVVQALLSTLVPVLLVRGAPVALMLRALPAARCGAAPGPREWLTAIFRSPLTRLVTNPIVAWVMFVAGICTLYSAPVFEVAVSNHAVHMLTNTYLVFSGYLFFAAVLRAGRSQSSSLPARMALVGAALVTYFCVGLLTTRRDAVLGKSFYRSLKLAWHSDLLADQRLGGQIASAAALLAALSVIALLVAQRRNCRGSHKCAEQPTTTNG